MAGIPISYGWVLFHYVCQFELCRSTEKKSTHKGPWAIETVFFKWLHPLTILPKVQEGFPFVYILTSTCYLWLFEVSHSNRLRWYLTMLLMAASPIINDVEHLFLCLFVICTSSLEKCLLRSFVHFYDFYFFIILFLHCFPDSFIDLRMSSDISLSFFGVITLNYLSGRL